MQTAGLAFDELGESWTQEGGSSVGVLLLSVGSPETPDDVEVCLLLSHRLLARSSAVDANAGGRSPA
jgi:hypothetical protein